MGITANYKDSLHNINNAYIKVERIWGSKNEGWHCWVGVYKNPNDAAPCVPLFSVDAPYIEDESPFKALYAAIGQIHQIQPEKIIEPNIVEGIYTTTKMEKTIDTNAFGTLGSIMASEGIVTFPEEKPKKTRRTKKST